MFQRLRDLFDAPEAFREPTDAEIMKALGGSVRVISARPEDFPGFKKSRSEPMDLPMRAEAITSFIRNTCPALVQNYAPEIWDPNNAENLANADSRSAFVRSFFVNGRPSLFFLIRPSNQISAKEELASTSNIDQQNLVSFIPEHHHRFITMKHEIGHMAVKMRPINFGADSDHAEHYEELLVDCSALVAYRAQGGSEENVRKYIAARAVQGFLQQPAKYWLAPNLKATLLDGHDLNLRDTYMPVWKAYTELRARVILRLMVMNMDRFASDELVDACFAAEQKAPDWDSHLLAREMQRIDEYMHYPGYSWAINAGAVFRELDRVIHTVDLPPFTKACGEQILDAADLLCPKLVLQNNWTPQPRNDNGK